MTLDKECWEPVLSKLFEMRTDFGTPLHVREAWSIDSPNHGESAILNEDILGSRLISENELPVG